MGFLNHQKVRQPSHNTNVGISLELEGLRVARGMLLQRIWMFASRVSYFTT